MTNPIHETARVHLTADVSPGAKLGERTRVWHEAQIREGARLGDDCIVGKGVYIDFDVQIGNAVKIQNHASIYHDTWIEDGVFVGPQVVFTNDMRPRAINGDGTPKDTGDWPIERTTVHYGASLGAGSIVLPGINVGRFALVGAGAVVTRDVPDHAIVVGNPARLAGFACACAGKLHLAEGRATCTACGQEYGVESTASGELRFYLEEN